MPGSENAHVRGAQPARALLLPAQPGGHTDALHSRTEEQLNQRIWGYYKCLNQISYGRINSLINSEHKAKTSNVCLLESKHLSLIGI